MTAWAGPWTPSSRNATPSSPRSLPSPSTSLTSPAAPPPATLPSDPPPLLFSGAYEPPQPRPSPLPWPPAAGADVPPAHLTHGYGDDAKLLQVGVTSVVDELGAVPLLSQCLDGNAN